MQQPKDPEGSYKKAKKVEEIDRYVMIEFDEEEVLRKIIKEKQLIDMSRSEWYDRKLEYLYQWDNFVDYKHAPIIDGQPYFHMPVTHEKMQAWHARMYKTITSMDPMFTVRPLNDVSLDEIIAVKKVMQWYLRDEINHEQGMKPIIDELLWDLGSDGWAMLYRRWDLVQRQFIDLEKNVDAIAFREEVKDLSERVKKAGRPPRIPKEYKEVAKVITIFSGIVLETVPHENCYFPEYIPTSGDMNHPKILIIESMRDAEDYIRGKQQGLYNAKAVDEALRLGKGAPQDVKTALKRERKRLQGIESQLQTENEEFLTDTVFYRDDLDGDGVYEEYVFTINMKSRQFLRKTYLDRICRDGKRPCHKFDLNKRPRSAYSRGIPEMLYSLNAEIDDFHNIRRASGLIANIPWGFYRANSGLEKEVIEVAPGKFYPVDDPQSDVKAMNFPNVTSWALQEEQLAQSYADRLTAMPSYMQGAVSGPVGPLRSNSGLQSLLQEAQYPLDVYLDRFRVSFDGLLRGILSDLGSRLEPVIWLRVLGEDGEPLWDMNTKQMVKEPILREYLSNGKYKFNLAANDAQNNPEKEKQDAMAVAQALTTQLNVQMGIVSPQNLYNINRDLLLKNNQRELEKYITKPEMVTQPLNLFAEITALSGGHMPMIVINDNHEEKIAGLMAFVNSEEYQEGKACGNISRIADQLFDQAIKTHQKFLSMIQGMPAMPNQSGMEIPVTMGARQSGMGPGQSNEEQLDKQGAMDASSQSQGSAGAAVPNAGMGGPSQS